MMDLTFISPIHWLLALVVLAIVVIPYWKIFPRAGWPAPLALLMLFPPLHLIILYILAFKKWPGDKP
ncbi:MAG: hypothetical protein KGQ46_12785 [Hyphomicrobiales bacterium]|nr:hypothetical protein [Hyphomicrobiales bacterium]MDE2114502.1 hypothetical protein [Hyphomicrobiales bacterium]